MYIFVYRDKYLQINSYHDKSTQRDKAANRPTERINNETSTLLYRSQWAHNLTSFGWSIFWQICSHTHFSHKQAEQNSGGQ